MQPDKAWIVGEDSQILVTGSAGFIGRRVVKTLMQLGFRKVRCFVRPSSNIPALREVLASYESDRWQLFSGNLLSQEDCIRAARKAEVILHLVTGRGKSFPGCFRNSVVTTRNLLDAAVEEGAIARFVNVSSFAVYSNFSLRSGAVLDEECSLEQNLEKRHDAYVYAKLKQDELVQEYSKCHGLPYVTIRPSVVFGPGRKGIPGAVGLDTFGFFMHLGGGNRLPLTFVDNCADAIALAGLVTGVEGRIYNIVDDDLPKSRTFLRRYKQEVRRFRSLRVSYPLFYAFCGTWEHYSRRSNGQLPPVFNRRYCSFHWKGHHYSNSKAKKELGWQPQVPMAMAMERYFEYQRNGG